MQYCLIFQFIILCVHFHLSALPDRYQLIDLGLLDRDSSEVSSINNSGETCGIFTERGSSYAFVWSKNDSNYKSFRSPNKIIITNTCVIFGSYYDWVSRGHWDLDQETIYRWENPFRYFTYFNCDDIGYPPSLFSTGNRLCTVALWDANDHEQLLVMNNNVINRKYNYEIWLYDKKKFNRINHPLLNAAIKINNHSQILGFHFNEILSEDGEPTNAKGKMTVIYDLKNDNVSLFNFPGETWGEDINDLGQVVGVMKNLSKSFGFYGTPEQVVSIENFSPIALNNYGQIIGKMMDRNDPAIWENGKLIRLSDHMTNFDNNGQEWDRIDALTGINDLGEIIGQGVYKGKPHGFLLIPVE